MKNPFKKKQKTDRDPEAEFRLAVGIMMRKECEKHNTCNECPFRRDDIQCVTVMRECGV